MVLQNEDLLIIAVALTAANNGRAVSKGDLTEAQWMRLPHLLRAVNSHRESPFPQHLAAEVEAAIQAMRKMLPSQFTRVLWYANMDPAYLPGEQAPLATRITALVSMATNQNQLAALVEAIRKVAPHLMP